MKLNKLINIDCELDIKGITADSREVKAGYLFGAIFSDEYINPSILKRRIVFFRNKIETSYFFRKGRRIKRQKIP